MGTWNLLCFQDVSSTRLIENKRERPRILCANEHNAAFLQSDQGRLATLAPQHEFASQENDEKPVLRYGSK